jgi:hypothetical protein
MLVGKHMHSDAIMDRQRVAGKFKVWSDIPPFLNWTDFRMAHGAGCLTSTLQSGQ